MGLRARRFGRAVLNEPLLATRGRMSHEDAQHDSLMQALRFAGALPWTFPLPILLQRLDSVLDFLVPICPLVFLLGLQAAAFWLLIEEQLVFSKWKIVGKCLARILLDRLDRISDNDESQPSLSFFMQPCVYIMECIKQLLGPLPKHFVFHR